MVDERGFWDEHTDPDVYLKKGIKTGKAGAKGTYAQGVKVKKYLDTKYSESKIGKQIDKRVSSARKAPDVMSKYVDKSIHHLTAPQIRSAGRQAGKEAYAGIKTKWKGSEFNQKYISPKVKNFKENESVKAAGATLREDYKKIKDSKVGKFFGRQAGRTKKEIKSFTKRPSKYVFGKEKSAVSTTLKATRAIAIANLNAAAEIQVNEKGIFAVFQPIFWGCKLGALAMSSAYPILITILIFGIFFGTWFFGLISAYYAIHFLRCIPAVIINTFLTIANAIWFAAMGIYNVIVLGIVTLINTIFHFFVGPVYEAPVLSSILGQMPTISHKYTIQPDQGFLYLYPNPMEMTGNISTIFFSILSYSWLRPGENPYTYIANDVVTYPAFVDDMGTELRYPPFNPRAVSNSTLWGDLKLDKPPPQFYDFVDPAIWGVLMIDGVFKPLSQINFFRMFTQKQPPILAAIVDMIETITSGPRHYRVINIDIPKEMYVYKEFTISWDVRVYSITSPYTLDFIVDDEVLRSWGQQQSVIGIYKFSQSLLLEQSKEYDIAIQAYYTDSAGKKYMQSRVEFSIYPLPPYTKELEGATPGVW